MKTMGMSRKGYESLIEFEGAFGKVYDDLASTSEKRAGLIDCYSAQGTPTIGVGHVVYHTGSWEKDECARFSNYFRSGDTMSQDDIIKLMKEDIPKYEKYVDDKLQVPITQEMYDSLVHMAFNTGQNASAFKKALEYTNLKQWENASEAIRNGPKRASGGSGELPGLVRRRNYEADWYLSGGTPTIFSGNIGKAIGALLLLGGVGYVYWNWEEIVGE